MAESRTGGIGDAICSRNWGVTDYLIIKERVTAIANRRGFGGALGVRGMGRVVAGLDDQGAFEVDGGLGADVFDPAFPVLAEEIVAETVMGRVDERFEAMFELGPLGGVDLAFEDGVLDALAEVEAGLGHAAEAGVAVGCGGGHVVGDQDHHGRVG